MLLDAYRVARFVRTIKRRFDMAQIPASDLEGFRGTIAGDVLTADDVGYGDARSVWNGAIDRRPAIIAQCASAEDVAASIGFARDHGLEISVRGGGHSFAGFAVCDGGLMVDLSGMRSVAVDPVARRATCGGGSTWGDLDAASQAHGLAVTGGFISTTGIGGLTLGGGIGWLTRKIGLSSDNLTGAEVVTADGRVLRASEDENGDLFWAIRGGGGNFGVVTSFEYRLAEAGPLVQLGFFFWDVDAGGEALRFGRDLARTLPEDMGVLIAGLSAPPAPFVPQEHSFRARLRVDDRGIRTGGGARGGGGEGPRGGSSALRSGHADPVCEPPADVRRG
jgi:FAD/FMN-containing dehydrogenase